LVFIIVFDVTESGKTRSFCSTGADFHVIIALDTAACFVWDFALADNAPVQVCFGPCDEENAAAVQNAPVQICAISEKPSAGKYCRLNRNPTEKHSVLKSWLSRYWSVRFEILSLRGTGHNDLADAFRHISWTMMTRRYIGITRTKFYGWGNEQKRIFSSGGIECSEKWMDLHNNKVGYKTMYWFFRNKPTLSKKDYKGWCDRIETYIDSTHINGHHVLGSWLNSSSSDDYILTCKQIRKDHRKNISSIKYIFIK
jgi:hypothetical protein